jgi:NAD(P)H-dependent flavin oxidoreductase YrpB (nitropropane dioxygenase family)
MGNLISEFPKLLAVGGSIVGSGTAIVSAAELIAAVSAATSTTALSSTNPSIEAVTEEVLDAVLAPAHDVPMEPSSKVFDKVKFFLHILSLDLKCVL